MKFALLLALALAFPVTLSAADTSAPPLSSVRSLPGVDMPPVIPSAMSDSRFNALKKFFEDKDPEIQRGALCQFASTQRTRQDSHSLRLIKLFVRLVEQHTPADGVMEPETTYACALEALTTTLMTHGTFRESNLYKSAHFGGIGTPAFIKDHLVPIYLPILQDASHKLHMQSYYVFITIGEGVAKSIVPTLASQLNEVETYTPENRKQVDIIVRTLHVMGAESKPAVPKMIELLVAPGEVDYEGDFGYDGKRGLNATLITALFDIAGHEEKYQRVMLKAFNRAIDEDEVYWSDKIRPQALPGTADLGKTMEEGRTKLLKVMGLEDVQDMKDLF